MAQPDCNENTPPALICVPEIHRAPAEFDELPNELPDASVEWTNNTESNRD
jgi:hypothetical protein